MAALVRRDVLIEAAETGWLPSRLRARRRIGTSSEALRAGPRVRRRIGTSSEALRAGTRARGPRARRRVGTSFEALRCGPRANRRIGRGLVVVSWLRYLQGLSNFFGSCLGYPFLWCPTPCFPFYRPRESTGYSGGKEKNERERKAFRITGSFFSFTRVLLIL